MIGPTQFSSNYLISEKKMEGSYKLSEGDIIKLGKIIFLVRKIVIYKKETKKKDESFISNSINNNSVMILDSNNNINDELVIHKYNRNEDFFEPASIRTIKGQTETKKDKSRNFEDNNNVSNSVNNKLKYLYIKLKNVKENLKNKPLKCRICFSEGSFEGNNPLISPCNCTGSVKYIHLNCLRKWLTSKVTVKSSPAFDIYCYSYKYLECEICRSKISEQVEYRGKIISLLDFKNVDPPYLIMQTINLYNPKSKFIDFNAVFVISFKKKNFLIIGRGSNSDIKLNDISVSRNHSMISYSNGGIFIDDIGSKFGTLLLIQNNILFLPYKELNIQTGKCHFIFYLLRTFLGCFKCYKNKFFDKLSYEENFNSQEKKVYSKIIESYLNNIIDPIEKFNCINNSFSSDMDNDNNDKEEESNNNIKINSININKQEIKNDNVDKMPTLNINDFPNIENIHKLNNTGSFIIKRLNNSLENLSNNNNEVKKQNESNEMLFHDINNTNINKIRKNDGTSLSILNILKRNNKKRKLNTFFKHTSFNILRNKK